MSQWHEVRKKRNHRTLPGFPWEGVFASHEEIDAYFQGESVQCLLCGRRLKDLGNHLRRIHDTSPEDYKTRYGLPYSRGLESEASHRRRQKAAYENMNEGKVPYITDDSLRPKGQGTQQHDKQPFDKARIVKQALSVHGQERKWEAADYERILFRMLQQQRLLTDVCKDDDLPSVVCWNRFCKKNPDLKLMERAQDIHNTLPYATQAKTRKFPMCPQFAADCQKLVKEGLTYPEIGEKFRVSSTSVKYALEGDPRKGKKVSRNGSNKFEKDSTIQRLHLQCYKETKDA